MDGEFSKQDQDMERGPARTAARTSLFLLTTIQSEAGADLGKARVRNLSATGMMADCESSLTRGQRVVLTLRGIGAVSGVVAWANGERVGIQFDHDINPDLARKPVGQVQVGLPHYLRNTGKFSRGY